MATARNKHVEGAKYESAVLPERFTGTATTTYYNGTSATTSAIMIDSRDFDDADVVVQFGTVLGEYCTVTNSVIAGATNNPMAATAVTGASFTDTNSANDERIRLGSIEMKGQARYFAVETEIQTTNSVPFTVDFASLAVLGRPDTQPTSTDNHDFDV